MDAVEGVCFDFVGVKHLAEVVELDENVVVVHVWFLGVPLSFRMCHQ
jgi:hypothetical protein